MSQQSKNPLCIIKYRGNFTVYYGFPPLFAWMIMEILKTYQSKEATRKKEANYIS
jgi:hypothetical protein